MYEKRHGMDAGMLVVSFKRETRARANLYIHIWTYKEGKKNELARLCRVAVSVSVSLALSSSLSFTLPDLF